MKETKGHFAAKFREAGFRITRQRERIFEFLARAREEGVHPSARQVFQGLARGSGLSVATVYNTLGALVRLGLIKVIEFESGDNRYETNLVPHVNLICSGCAGIEDLHGDYSIHVKCAREKAGFTVRDYRMEYYGLCARCVPA